MNGNAIELVGLIVAFVAFGGLIIFGTMVWMGNHIGPILPPTLPRDRDTEATARIERLHEREAKAWKRVRIPLALMLVVGVALAILGAIQQ